MFVQPDGVYFFLILLNFSMMEFGLEIILRMVKTSKYFGFTCLELFAVQVADLKVENQVVCLKLVNQVFQNG